MDMAGTGECRWNTPPDENALTGASKEWVQTADQHGNTYYYNTRKQRTADMSVPERGGAKTHAIRKPSSYASLCLCGCCVAQ